LFRGEESETQRATEKSYRGFTEPDQAEPADCTGAESSLILCHSVFIGSKTNHDYYIAME